jgi:hypothetical protein
MAVLKLAAEPPAEEKEEAERSLRSGCINRALAAVEVGLIRGKLGGSWNRIGCDTDGGRDSDAAVDALARWLLRLLELMELMTEERSFATAENLTVALLFTVA